MLLCDVMLCYVSCVMLGYVIVMVCYGSYVMFCYVMFCYVLLCCVRYVTLC